MLANPGRARPKSKLGYRPPSSSIVTLEHKYNSSRIGSCPLLYRTPFRGINRSPKGCPSPANLACPDIYFWNRLLSHSGRQAIIGLLQSLRRLEISFLISQKKSKNKFSPWYKKLDLSLINAYVPTFRLLLYAI